MKLLYSAHKTLPHLPGSAITIGNFDGVHKGHQALLSQLKDNATRLNLPTIIILFEPQPQEFFLSQGAPARLMTLREKIDCFKALGVDYVFCIKFNKTIAQMSYKEFATTYFFSFLNARYMLLGNDFRFGQSREGDYQQLKNLSEADTCQIETFADFTVQDQRVSSTIIRKLLIQTEFKAAELLLGRRYGVCGRVIKGAALGRQWGVPTANINRSFANPPFSGVFCVTIRRENGHNYYGIANLGCRPTVDGIKSILEVHFLQGTYDLYGERLQIYFETKLRDEIKFASLEALIAQIQNDVLAAKRYFELT